MFDVFPYDADRRFVHAPPAREVVPRSA
jgi:hypothetical protein